MSGIKIKVDRNGRVDLEVMRILREFAEHRDVCEQCGAAFRNKRQNYCKAGLILLADLGNHPDVSPATEEDFKGLKRWAWKAEST